MKRCQRLTTTPTKGFGSGGARIVDGQVTGTNDIPIDLLKHGEMKSYIYQWMLLSKRKPGQSAE